jgi:hypothetical protein
MPKLRPTPIAPVKAVKTASSGSYKVAATLPDGVKILKPKSQPTHFTAEQIRSTIQEVREASRKGRTTRSKA